MEPQDQSTEDFEIPTIPELAQMIANQNKTDVYCYSGPIDGYGCNAICQILLSLGSFADNAILFLKTNGGDADCAYMIARAFQNYYSNGSITVAVERECKSAGTLLAIGASEIAMGPLAELGPLDVQIAVPDEAYGYERRSGLTAGAALGYLSSAAVKMFQNNYFQLQRHPFSRMNNKAAASVAAQLTAETLSPIFAQIDPLRLADHSRATEIATAYGSRLDVQTGNLKQNALQRLVYDYPSHEFVIDFREANELFNRVRRLHNLEFLLMFRLEQEKTEAQRGNHVYTDCLANYADHSSPTESDSEASYRAKTDLSSRDTGPADVAEKSDRQSDEKDSAEV